MVFLDVVLGILLAYGAIRGIWNGFFTEIASLLSLIVGVFVAIKFSIFMREFLSKHVSWDPQNIRIAAFVLTFVAVVIGISLLAKFFTTIANFSGLGLFNKLLGGILGIVKMALIISIVLNLFARLNSGEGLADKETIEKSKLYNPIRKIAAKIYPSLEAWFKDCRSQNLLQLLNIFGLNPAVTAVGKRYPFPVVKHFDHIHF